MERRNPVRTGFNQGTEAGNTIIQLYALVNLAKKMKLTI